MMNEEIVNPEKDIKIITLFHNKNKIFKQNKQIVK